MITSLIAPRGIPLLQRCLARHQRYHRDRGLNIAATLATGISSNQQPVASGRFSNNSDRGHALVVWRQAGHLATSASVSYPDRERRLATRYRLAASARPVLRLLAVAAAVAIAAALARAFRVNSATAGFCFLVLILGLATRAKLSEAIAASFLSVAAYNFFFLPPVGTFTIADPQNWIALIAFLVTAVTASQLSASARQRAEEARARQAELERMYRFSRALMLGEEGLPFAQQVLKQVLQCFDVNECGILRSKFQRACQLS